MIKVAINGFGRIGRLFLRSIIENDYSDISVVAINDVGNLKSLCHLLQYDSVHGKMNSEVRFKENQIIVANRTIKCFSNTDPKKLPWNDLDIDLVVDCTGVSRDKSFFMQHIDAGATRVIVSTIINDADYTVVYGVNHEQINEKHQIISNASCTSNCLIATLYPINKAFGIEAATITSIHSYTNDQSLVDSSHPDLRRARSVHNSIIPSYTNASRAVDIILPSLKEKIHCTAARVPISNVSMLDCNILLSSEATEEEMNNVLVNSSRTDLLNVIECSLLELVSVDYIHNPHSAIIDLTQTKIIKGRLCKIASWYDNEWGYVNRMCDVINHIRALNY